MTINAALARVGALNLSVLVTAVGARADADDGEKLARRWCAACHLVASDQKQASTTFRSIL